MADDQASSNEVNEGADAQDLYDDDVVVETATTVVENVKTTLADDYPEEPIEDYVVNLVVNEQPEGVSLSTPIVDAAVTEFSDSMLTSKSSAIVDAVNEYTTQIYNEVSDTTAAITDGKRWWGWSTQKLLLVGLIALCILAIIVAVLCVVLGKKFKKNKRSGTAGPATTTKAVVTKGISPDPKYQPVPNV